MGRAVHIVVTCTNRKTRAVPPGLRLRELKATNATDRAAEWAARLEIHPAPKAPAVDLYSGDHWYVARSLRAVGAEHGLDARMWVCSAGYGLVPIVADLHPYSATFTTENPDAIRRLNGKVSNRAADREWWSALAQWQGPSPGAPRSFRELAARNPRTPILVVASPRYVAAIRGDLVGARDALQSPDLLSVFSSGTPALDGLATNLIPCDARLQAVVGGARFSLSARAARLALRNHRRFGLRSPELRQCFVKLLDAQPETARHDRASMSDAEVRSYIRETLERDPHGTRTGLLRRLRDNEQACEEKRFGVLFRKVREESGVAHA